jgi:iron/zinc/copper transport system permease protein
VKSVLELVFFSLVVGGFMLSAIGYYISRLGLSTITFSAAHAALAGAAISTILNSNPYALPAAFTLCLGLVLGLLTPRVSTAIINSVSMMLFSLFNSIALIGIYLSNAVVLSTARVGGLLWGSPLAITVDRFMYIVALTTAFLIYLLLYKHKLDAIVFDKKLAEAEGINVQLHTSAIIIFMCIALVLMLEIVGGFLVFALVYIPYITAVATTTRADLQLLIASIFGILTAPLGAYLSLLLDLPIGSTIALTASLSATAIYAIEKAIEKLRALVATGD